MRRLHPASTAVAAGLLLSVTGCDILGGGIDFAEPIINLRSATLSEYPGIQTLAAYYCPDVLGAGIPGLACGVAFGPAPAASALNFYFDLDFDAGNNGPVPIPIVEALVGLNLFPGQAEQNLGTACVTFCQPNDPTCNGNSGSGSCANPTPPPGSAWDIAAGAADLLFAVADGGVDGLADNLLVRTIPPGENINLRMTFGIDPLKMLTTLGAFSGQMVNNLTKGQGFALDVPYSVQGNLFYDVSRFGRFDLPFGPFDDSWKFTD